MIFFYAHSRFLQLVDVLVDLFERLRVGGAEKLSARDLGDFIQPGLVEFHALVFVEDVPQSIGERAPRGKDRHRRDPVNARADGVEVDVKRPHCFRRRIGWNFSGVIFSIS